jgi:hypothetical protein
MVVPKRSSSGKPVATATLPAKRKPRTAWTTEVRGGNASDNKIPPIMWSKVQLLTLSFFYLTQDDNSLIKVLNKHGVSGDDLGILPSKCKWTDIAKDLHNGRNGKQCRDRWQNYLRPGIKKGEWTRDEEELIKDMHRTFGPK